MPIQIGRDQTAMSLQFVDHVAARDRRRRIDVQEQHRLTFASDDTPCGGRATSAVVLRAAVRSVFSFGKATAGNAEMPPRLDLTQLADRDFSHDTVSAIQLWI